MNGTCNPRDETRRRAYLALMGVQPYYARVAFKNAKPSPVCAEAPVEEAAPVAETASLKKAAPMEQAAAVKTSAAAAELPAQTKPAPDLGRQPLYYRRIDETLALAAADSWEGEDGAECRKLLANILKALGKAFNDADFQAEIAFPNPQSAQDEAGQGAVLEQLCQRDNCPNLLIFAHNSSELFPSASPSSSDFSRPIGGLAVRVTLTHGLREMLAFPDLKKYCWGHLQKLRARLSRSL